MRIFNLLFLILLVIAVLAPASAAKPGKREHICAFPGKPQVSAKKVKRVRPTVAGGVRCASIK